MPNLTGATNYFPKSYENTVPMTLGSSVLAGAATVPVNGMTNYTDGDVICFVVDGATPALKQVFTGTKSGSNIINAVWTEFPTGGVNVAHSAGATVIDYVSATHWDLFQKGITQSLNQDGSLKTTAVQTALNITGGAAGGWTPTGFAPSAVVANGNRSYNLTFAAADLTATLSAGMRIRTTRTVAAPTQGTSLNGTTQSWSKASPAGMTFTGNHSEGAYIYLTSYPTAQAGIIGRDSAAGNLSGWELSVNTNGTLNVYWRNASGASSFTTSQSVPLNKKVHIVASNTVATPLSVIYMDGVAVPIVTNSTTATSVVQAATNLTIGNRNSANGWLPGKIWQAFVASKALSSAEVLAMYSQGLTSADVATYSLVSAYSFNGNATDINTTNANDLTANGSAVATNADSPFGGQANGTISSTLDYAIVTAASFSTNTTLTVQVPEGCTIPTSGGVSAVSYATVTAPYGMPVQAAKWTVETHDMVSNNQSSPVQNTWYNVNSWQLAIPIGEWKVSTKAAVYITRASGTCSQQTTLSTANNSETDKRFTTYADNTPATDYTATLTIPSTTLSLAAQTTYYGNIRTQSSGVNGIYLRGDNGDAVIQAELAYL